MSAIKLFWRDDEGAVTADWALLCATLVGMATVTLSTIGGGTSDHSDRVEACLTAMSANNNLSLDLVARGEAMKDACNTAAAG